ncbi:hypothetical protein I4641_17080 [Waterburya agarophytonicola K14]|uniref:Uncharacterized protein n=1 Tax=Waterburya agarophytonicola KI4 TaxID=2874699 RepID=A0A964BTQ2_9CYAN|nr:hypothetical protein [Waterburya agarophytonicola]MCC0178686.1 hypothetical protein [Waterburya agarophytonicola KI4]
MKILRISLLAAILSLSWLWATPMAFAQQTRAEATYAKCQEVERYYFAQIQKPLPKLSNPNLTRPFIMAFGKGFFWNQPNDELLIPSKEANAFPVLALAKQGSYLLPRKITCDLNKGQIKIGMKAFLLLEERKKPLVIDQVDEMWWKDNSEVFEGKILFSTKEDGTFLQLDSDFTFRGCNADGVDCNSIDILFPFPVPDRSICIDLALANYGIEIENPSEIRSCTIYNDNLNYFQDNPREVVVYEKKGRQILGSHLQVMNNIWLDVTYQDDSVLEYRGAKCFMQYTSDFQQDWENRDFKTDLCSPREVIRK